MLRLFVIVVFVIVCLFDLRSPRVYPRSDPRDGGRENTFFVICVVDSLSLRSRKGYGLTPYDLSL